MGWLLKIVVQARQSRRLDREPVFVTPAWKVRCDSGRIAAEPCSQRENAMVITLGPDLEKALIEVALRQGVAPEDLAPQNLVEFRNVATRPAAANGLGLTPAEAEAKAADFEALFPLLAETADIYLAWKTLVVAAAAIGKQVHDARLVAVCHVNGVSH